MNVRTVIAIFGMVGTLMAQEAPTGSVEQPDKKEVKQLAEFKGKVTGMIAWASSRSNSKHDIWIMNADGTDKRQLSKGDNVDWYARFSPDGNTVLFTRSKSGWVPEGDAEVFDKWDIWSVGIDGSNETKVAENACWATWRPSGDSIVFARGPKVFVKDLVSGGEKEIFDAEVSLKKGAYAQQPQLSPDGTRLAMTLRGSRRETGIWNLSSGDWYSTGAGCQMEWFPDGKRVLRMNEGQGNGGTEVLAINLDEKGMPTDKISGISIPKKIRFMDIPGRRSHEYFPKLDQSGQWMVWCATQYGHEHDIADYEVYIWNITTDKKSGPVRLTFHSGNDRWPDIFTGTPKAKAAPASGIPPSEGNGTATE
ncbi:MAG: PD40 domain-containing protein [Chitinispirillaceae bacterium]|nr:PD40 domain-containing protein [Chitinispirillaceae bacterium]